MKDIYVVRGFLEKYMNSTNAEMFEPAQYPLNLPKNTPNYMIAVPRCHENLFNHIRKNHEWLSSGGASEEKGRETIFQKKITTQEDLDRLENLIQDLRLEKSEIFIDDSYHAKPIPMRIQDYVADYLKNKSVHTYYTFKSFYRITVFPVGTDIRNGPNPLWDQRKEYLIIPLYIILKRGKTYDQMKTLSYNDDGTFTVNEVNPHHFWKVHLTQEEEIEKKNKAIKDKAMREKVMSSMP